MLVTASLGFLRLAMAAASLTACAASGTPDAASAQQGPSAQSGERTGTVIVLNKNEASAWLIDAATGQVAARLPTGVGPHEVAVSPDGRRAVVTDYGVRGGPGNTLTVIDIPAKRVTATISLGQYQRPHGVAWLPDGKRVAVTSESSQAVVLVDVDAGRVEGAVATGAAGSHMLAVSPDGKRAYTANIPSGTVTALDLATGRAVGTAPAGRGSEGIALSPDGGQVWTGNREDQSVTIIDTRTMAQVATLPSARLPYRVLFTPDGREAVVANAESGHLRVFDVAGRREAAAVLLAYSAAETPGAAPAPAGTGAPLGLAVSSDSRWLFASDGENPYVAVVDLPARRVVAYFPTGSGPDGVGYSPLVVM